MIRGPQIERAISQHAASSSMRSFFRMLKTTKIGGQKRKYRMRIRRPWPEHARNWRGGPVK